MTTTARSVDRETRPNRRGRRAPALPWEWLGPLLVSAVAGVLVFHRLGMPHALVWDETYYAKDAWSFLHYGVERNWNVDREGRPANTFFLAGNPAAGLGQGGEWAAHPPMGKWLIAAGMALFGADPSGFRFASAAAAVLAVLILARTARRMTGSTVLGCAAGLLLALDGVWLVGGIGPAPNWPPEGKERDPAVPSCATRGGSVLPPASASPAVRNGRGSM
jgi:dolichyl-phosphate-mannose-protein mannosyltransferase